MDWFRTTSLQWHLHLLCQVLIKKKKPKTKTKINILIISIPPLLSISSDDGARIYVDGKLIVDAWYDRAPAESSGTITLDVGRRHAITYQVRHSSFFSLFISFLFFIFYIMFIHSLTFFQYYENGGGAVAQLRWSHACEAKAIVPQSQLFSA